MADDLANLCRFLFDDTAFPSLSSSASSDLFSRRLSSDDSIKRGLYSFYLLLRWGIAPIGADDDSSGKLRFETWSDSQVQALVSISQAILLLSRSLLGTDLTLNSLNQGLGRCGFLADSLIIVRLPLYELWYLLFFFFVVQSLIP